MGRKALFAAFALCVTAASIAGVLYGFELCCSPYNRLPPNGVFDGERYTWGHRAKDNRFGFREREFQTPKPPGVYRVMVLGDSFTWGYGLALEERYTAIAEARLNQASAGRRFEVLAFANPGYPTIRQRDLLDEHKREVDPDLIVVGFCLNDPQWRDQDYSIERHQLRRSLAGRLAYRLRLTAQDAGLRYTADLIDGAFYGTAERMGWIPAWPDALQRAYEPSSNEWRFFVQALREIRRISDGLRLPPPIFAVLNQGKRSSDYDDPPEYLRRYLAWWRQAEEAARDAGFMTYNHEREIPRQIEDEPIYLNVLDSHPAANLHRVYGQKLYRKIAELLDLR